MLITEFIRQKRMNHAHSPEAIKEFIDLYSRDGVPDYQVASWLMAVCLNGMTDEEAMALTDAMVHSGKKLEWPANPHIPCDKHSTGGIGDKTSLIIAPLVASFGIPVPMMAGRGLGFTGGTLDKLESIPGFQTRISLEKLKTQMKELGFFLVGQTEEICPADKRMYSLRDVTSTVESLPLICASILSKKIAEGAKALVMDVKVGSGAFMSSLKEAENLSKALIKIGRVGGMKVRSLITDMNQPLGRFVGNALEVKECLDILKGESKYDSGKTNAHTKELSLEFSAQMLALSGYNSDLEICRKLCLENLESGKAFEFFEKLISTQGGDLKSFKASAKKIIDVPSPESGFLNFTSNKHVGIASLLLGGGRQKSSDHVDFQVGVEVLKEHGQAVSHGETLFRIHHSDNGKLEAALKALSESFEISSAEPKINPLIHQVLT